MSQCWRESLKGKLVKKGDRIPLLPHPATFRRDLKTGRRELNINKSVWIREHWKSVLPFTGEKHGKVADPFFIMAKCPAEKAAEGFFFPVPSPLPLFWEDQWTKGGCGMGDLSASHSGEVRGHQQWVPARHHDEKSISLAEVSRETADCRTSQRSQREPRGSRNQMLLLTQTTPSWEEGWEGEKSSF